jgi:serine/threonine protein kinase
MEEAVGGDVGSLVRYGKRKQEFLKMGEQAVQFIGGSVVLGLEYLHAQHILYRDLKAENILLFADGYAKLSDFGLAKLVVEDEIHKTQAGTALYNAPEMVMRVGYNKCVDFWALGVLFYELATGETPFKLEDVSTKIRFKRIAME